MKMFVERYVTCSELEEKGAVAMREFLCDAGEMIGRSGSVYAGEFWLPGGLSPYFTCFLFYLFVERLLESGLADGERDESGGASSALE